MTTKFTKKQLEKIIKEEVSKLILEEEKPRAAASNSELVDFFLDQAKKISDNPSYRPKPRMEPRKISDLKDGMAGRVFPPTYKHNRPRIIAKEWGLYRKKILQNKTFWFDVVGKLSTFARREVTNGVTDAHFTVFVQA